MFDLKPFCSLFFFAMAAIAIFIPGLRQKRLTVLYLASVGMLYADLAAPLDHRVFFWTVLAILGVAHTVHSAFQLEKERQTVCGEKRAS